MSSLNLTSKSPLAIILNYDRFMAEKKARYFSLPACLGRRRLPRRRPRDREEREILMKMDKKRLEMMMARGELVTLSPRHFRLS